MNLLVRDLIQTGEGIPTNGIPLPSSVGITRIGPPGQNYPALTVPRSLLGLAAAAEPARGRLGGLKPPL